jgi:predicted ribosomally synthesized peptide with SipW-like signal peptide
MKKIVLSIGSILFAGAILAGGTGAFLSDTETSTGNTFATGVIDLQVDNESYVTNNAGQLALSPSTSWSLGSLAGKLFFNFSDLKPGDIGEDTISLHVNNNDAWACMNILATGTPENGQNDPEAAVDPTAGANDGELQNNLFFNFWADDGDNVYEQGEQIFKAGLAKDIFNGQNWALADASKNVWGGTSPIPGDSVRYVGKAWCFGAMSAAPVPQDGKGKLAGSTNGPLVRGTGFSCSGTDVGNIVQSDGLKADVSFSVAQARSNGSYLCSGLVLGTTTPPGSSSTLFSDDFNSCSKGKEFNKIDQAKWDTTGGVKGDDWGPPQGKVAFLDAGTKQNGPNHTATLTTTAFSTTGYKNITLKYQRNIDAPPSAPMTLTVAYSVDNGATWTTLETTSADSNTTLKTFSLSPSADNKAAVKVRFTLVGTNASDHVYIDNVVITGITI